MVSRDGYPYHGKPFMEPALPGVSVALRIAVWVTVLIIIIIVVMAAFARLAPVGSDLQQFGQGFFDFLDRITPGD